MDTYERIIYAALIAYREARRRHRFQEHGEDFVHHEPDGKFTQITPRDADEQEFIDALITKLKRVPVNE